MVFILPFLLCMALIALSMHTSAGIRSGVFVGYYNIPVTISVNIKMLPIVPFHVHWKLNCDPKLI